MTVTEHTRHLTASAAVFDPARRLVLLVDHISTGQRQFPGGHLDPDETGDACALREVAEETGVTARVFRLLDGDTPIPGGVRHPGPLMVVEFPAPAWPGCGEPAHSHIDLMYVATADSTRPLVAQEAEVTAAAWLPIDTIRDATVRPDVPPVVRAAWAHMTGEDI